MVRLIRHLLVTVVLAALAALPQHGIAGEGIDFWSQQKRGANFFNTAPLSAPLDGARELGLGFVRLTADKWKPASGRDFLLRNADEFVAVDEADLKTLISALDDAHARGHRIVLTMLSLPGCRWSQNNGGQDDARLWTDARYRAQAAAFWRDLAGRLKDHPAIAGYDPLNEPHPEKAAGIDGTADERFAAWLEQSRGTPADLDAFYAEVIAAIRQVDQRTPIVVEGWGYGDAAGLSHLRPIDDPAVLYSFHFYEPWNYTTFRVNRQRYAYPDRMPTGWDGPTEAWTPQSIEQRMQPVVQWAARHNIPPQRIIVGEFGCDRRVAGAQAYLADLIAAINRNGWHWAFYAYREDGWNAMDYEIGSEGEPGPRGQGPLWDLIRSQFSATRPSP
jgi:hypothetical protein